MCSENKNLDVRLRNLLIIFSTIQCYYALKLPIFRHQKFSLLIVGIIFAMTIFIETFIEISFGEFGSGKFSKLLLCIIVYYFFNSFPDTIEKYLMEYYYINPFKMVMYSGIFGFIITLIFATIMKYNFEDIYDIYENHKDKFIILIILLIVYFFYLQLGIFTELL